MKITAVEVFLLYDRFVYLKVETDEGISGWGGGSSSPETMGLLAETRKPALERSEGSTATAG